MTGWRAVVRGVVWGVPLVLLVPAAAAASPLFELSGGIHGQGGFNARATGPGSASAYFNPSLLPKADAGLDVSFMVINDRIDIGLHPRSSDFDVPDAYRFARAPDGGRLPIDAVPTQWLEEGQGGFEARPRQQRRDPTNFTSYAVVGITVPVFDQWLVFGFYGMVPMGDFTRASSYYVDEREQLFSNSLHAELYEDRLQATSLSFGLGSQLHEQFSIGVAATLSLTNEAQAPVYVPRPENLGDIRLLSDVNVAVGVAPHVGMHYEPHEDVHISFTAHSPSRFDIVAAYEFSLPDGSSQSSAVRFTHAYMPWKFALGGAWDVLESHANDVTIAGTVEYTLWSKYRDRTPKPIGENADLARVPDWPTAPYEWNDTVSGVLGVRWRHRAVRMMADGIFQPTPVPDQTGRTNYVDNHRIGAFLGAEAEFVLADTTFRAGGHFQLHRLLPRSTVKQVPDTSGDIPPDQVQDALPDGSVSSQTGAPVGEPAEGLQTNNPGFPGFDSQGWIIGAGLNLSVLF